MRVITLYKLMDLITSGDKIDQKEIISSLVWYIYYDPLLNYMQNKTKLGYRINVSWLQDLNEPESYRLKERISCLAYINDTTWVILSQQEL